MSGMDARQLAPAMVGSRHGRGRPSRDQIRTACRGPRNGGRVPRPCPARASRTGGNRGPRRSGSEKPVARRGALGHRSSRPSDVYVCRPCAGGPQRVGRPRSALPRSVLHGRQRGSDGRGLENVEARGPRPDYIPGTSTAAQCPEENVESVPRTLVSTHRPSPMARGQVGAPPVDSAPRTGEADVLAGKSARSIVGFAPRRPVT